MKHYKNLPFNFYSKHEDKALAVAMRETLEYANESLRLPDGYTYEVWKNLSFKDMQEWLIKRGFPIEETAYLTTKNSNGKYASVKPNSGILVAVKRNSDGHVEDWYILLAAESNYQNSTRGNAVERFFKNMNCFKALFEAEDVFPYLLFSQGEGYTSNFICNKLRIGTGSEINKDVNIRKKTLNVGGSILKKVNSNAFVRERKWEVDEIKGRLISALIQSHEYFFPQEAEATMQKF